MASFTHEQLTMAVHRYGHGAIPVLAFHGFGRSGHDFTLLGPGLREVCTIHAFDLPFHGRSPGIPAGGPVSLAAWVAYFSAYLHHIGTSSACLLGYSLGGRLALGLLEGAPGLVSQAYLLAPDGLVPRPWYRGMAHHRPGRWAYRRFVQNPGPTHAFAHLLHRGGLLSGRLHQFIMESTATPQSRELLYEVWTGFRGIEPRLTTVATNLRARNIPVHVCLGLDDRVIPPTVGRRLKAAAPQQVHLHLLPMGHRLLNITTGTLIASLIGST